MVYTITRNMNTFTIDNNSLDVLYATVYVQTYCGSNQWEILIPEQSFTSTITLTIPDKDDLYKIFISDKNTLFDEINISIFKEYLKSFVESVKDLLCGCPCQDCDCNETDKDLSSVLLKLLSYNIIVYHE